MDSGMIGLVRVLGPDIGGIIVATLAIVGFAWITNWVIGRAPAPDESQAAVVRAKRATRRFAFWIWLFVFAGFVAHAAAVTASLRIPRSDVDATGVYQRMNDATQGKSP